MLGGSGSTSVGLSVAALALVAAALVFSAVAKVVRPSRAGDALGAWTIPAALAAVLVVHVAAAATFLGAAARPWRLVRAQRVSLAGPRAFELAAGGEESAT